MEVADLRVRAEEARLVRIRLAREGDVASFCELVMRDDETGEEIEMAPVHCEWHALADKYDKLHIWAHVESGKTSQIAIARTLWELGRNRNLRFAIVSNTSNQAKKSARAIREIIEKSVELRTIFPDLKPGKPWGEAAFSVERASRAKDPSVQVCGVHGAIVGSRLDRIIYDDILDYENTKTHAQRENLKSWIKASLGGRTTKKGRILSIGTAWHPQDVLHDWAKNPLWHSVRYPAINAEGIPIWPDQWPPERIAKKREELGPIEFARQMMCVPRDDSTALFKQEWIDRCLALGEGRSMAAGLSVVPPGYATFTGVDLAVQRHSSADETVLFTIAIAPNGDREILEIDAGRWTGQEILDKICSAHHRYRSIVVVENNVAQDYIVQFIRGGTSIPIRPFTTGRNKAQPEFGVASLGVEMSNGKWIIPNKGGIMHKQVSQFVDECLYYDPKAHTGDRLMAAWFAREGHRLTVPKAETGSFDLLRR